MQNYKIDNLVSIQQNNEMLTNGLKLIKPRKTSGSLAAYDGFEFEELFQFKKIFCHELEDTITSSEPFPGEMLTLISENVDLSNDIFKCLITYYNEAYDDLDIKFISTVDLIEKSLQNDSSNRYIIVQPKIKQYGRIRMAAEIFGSVLTPRYKKNSYILAKFTQENNTVEIFSGQVQYYFEHELQLQTGVKTYRLVYVKWYLHTGNHRTRFYYQIDNDDDRSINIEL
jgi:hypothetical protein